MNLLNWLNYIYKTILKKFTKKYLQNNRYRNQKDLKINNKNC